MKKIENIISVSLYYLLIFCGKLTEKTFIKNSYDAFNINKKILFSILDINKYTAIGKKYNFSLINSIDDFKNSMPLTDYSFYEKYIKSIQNGNQNILTKKNIEYLGHTSGTTGNQKLIPVTKKSRLVASKYMAFLIQKIIYNNYKDDYSFTKGVLLTDISTSSTQSLNSKIPICSATSGGMKKMKHIIPFMYTTPLEIMYIQNKNTQLYLHTLFALCYRDLMYISGVFVSIVLDYFRIIEQNYKDLIYDIRTGKVNKKLDLDENLRKKINSYLTPNASLADKLEEEFSKGFKNIAKRLWPKAFIIICVSGANFTIYEKQVNFYTDFIPIYSPSLAATEGFIGANPFKDKIEYVITPDTAFFEFINIKDEEKKEPVTYTLDKLEINESYEIVLTSYAGLYRYRLGDVIKITGFYNKSPKFEFLYRKNQLLNMAAEKTTENHVKYALETFSSKEKIQIEDYTTFADTSKTPGHYTFFIEPSKDYRYNKYNLTNLEKSLDRSLMKSNPAYERFRKKQQLSCLKIKMLCPDTFEKVKQLMIKNGTSKNQIKIPRVVKADSQSTSSKILALLQNNIMK